MKRSLSGPSVQLHLASVAVVIREFFAGKMWSTKKSSKGGAGGPPADSAAAAVALVPEAAAAPKIRPWKVKPAEPEHPSSIIVQFQATTGEVTGPQIEVPFGTTRDQLEQILNSVLGSVDDKKPFSFFVSDSEIVDSLGSVVLSQVRPHGLVFMRVVPQVQSACAGCVH
jgi:hypothetical protein